MLQQILVEYYPILPIQQKSPKSDNIRHKFQIIILRQILIFFIILHSAADYLFHQMSRCLNARAIGMKPCLPLAVFDKL